MHDPLRHDHSNAGREGPFVESKGLLGSILQRPARPVDHTPTQHGPSVFEAPPAPTEPRSRSWELPWWLRNIRLVMILAFAAFGFVINLVDGQFDSSTSTSTPTPAVSIPGPGSGAQQGRLRVTPTEFLTDEWVHVTGENGESLRWKVDKPAVRKVLRDHMGEPVVGFWQQRGGITYMVGVVGERGAVAPETDDVISIPAEQPA